MGCDIHAYPEVYQYEYWVPISGKWRLDRAYSIFERLASVRGNEALFQPRGIPEDLGWYARDDYYLYIPTTPKAQEWIERGYSKIHNKSWITHPDWHTPSWLSLDEFKQCIGDFISYASLVAACEAYEKAGHKTRIVFWFDN